MMAKWIPSVVDEREAGDAAPERPRYFDEAFPVILTFLGQTDCASGSPKFPNVFIAESQAWTNFVTATVVALYRSAF